MHCPSGVSKVANLCVHCQRDHLQKTGEHNGLGDFHTVRSKTITGLEGGEGGDAHRLSDSIRTASGSDETIAQVSSPLGSALSARVRHLTIPGRKKTTKKKQKNLFTPEGPRRRLGADAHGSSCLDERVLDADGQGSLRSFGRQLQHPGELLTSRTQRLSGLPCVSTNTSVHRVHV